MSEPPAGVGRALIGPPPVLGEPRPAATTDSDDALYGLTPPPGRSINGSPPAVAAHAVAATVSKQRRADGPTPAPPVASANGLARPADATIVMPYAGSKTARRLHSLRGWMLVMPLDVVSMLLPMLWMDDHWRGAIFTAGLTVAILTAGGLYRSRRHLSFLDELPAVTGRLLASAAIVAVIFSMRHDPATYLGEFMRTVAVAGGLLLVSRATSRWLINMARRRRWVEHGAIIVGGGPVAAEIARLLRRHPQYGLRVAGFIDDEASQHRTRDLMPWIGPVDELETMIVSTHTKVIIIADASAASEEKLVDLVRRPVAMSCDLLVVPRLFDFSTQGSMPDHIGAIPVMRIRRPTLTGPRWALKRSTDVITAIIALVLLSPLLVICAGLVRLEGGPGVLFRQERVGRHGRRFQVIKFRSMRPDERDRVADQVVGRERRAGRAGRPVPAPHVAGRAAAAVECAAR